MDKIRTLAKLGAMGLALLSISTELRKDPAERTWHGKVLGVVPYDYRFPTLERVKETYWNEDNPSIISGPLFGVGWAINFKTVADLVTGEQHPAVPKPQAEGSGEA